MYFKLTNKPYLLTKHLTEPGKQQSWPTYGTKDQRKDMENPKTPQYRPHHTDSN